jgi:hypothetical protein
LKDTIKKDGGIPWERRRRVGRGILVEKWESCLPRGEGYNSWKGGTWITRGGRRIHFTTWKVRIEGYHPKGRWERCVVPFERKGAVG